MISPPRISVSSGHNFHKSKGIPDRCHFPHFGKTGTGIKKTSLSKASLSGGDRGCRQAGTENAAEKRNAASGKNREAEAFLTVEASLAVTVFLYISLLFFTFFEGQQLELRLQRSLDEIAGRIAMWSHAVSYAEDYTGFSLDVLTEEGLLSEALGGDTGALEALLSEDSDLVGEIGRFLAEKGSALLWQELVRGWLVREAAPAIERCKVLKNGKTGLSLSGSSLHDDSIDLVLSYRIVSPVHFPLGLSYPVVQRSCRRLWTGTGGTESGEAEKEEEEPRVFVTAHGEVYHSSLSCRILNLDIRQAGAAQIAALRNESGAKYYPCEKCLGGKAVRGGTVFYTPYGTRYHAGADCSKIARDIFALPLSEAKTKYRACFYCGAGGTP